MFTPADFPGRAVQGDAAAGAVLSFDEVYRYVLWRAWDPPLPFLIWCMLNPSTADHRKDDATVRKVRGFSRRMGFGGLVIVNLMAFRSRFPVDLIAAQDPAGPLNMDSILRVVARHSPRRIMCAWGGAKTAFGKMVVRHSTKLQTELRGLSPSPALYCLKLTADGQPWHPVMAPYALEPVPWSPPTQALENILI